MPTPRGDHRDALRRFLRCVVLVERVGYETPSVSSTSPLISHLIKALMLVLEFLAKFVKRCLHLGECGIGVFERLLVVLLLAWQQQINIFQVT